MEGTPKDQYEASERTRLACGGTGSTDIVVPRSVGLTIAFGGIFDSLQRSFDRLELWTQNRVFQSLQSISLNGSAALRRRLA